MPTITLVLMGIGAVGILISIVSFLYALAYRDVESPFDRVTIGSFLIGQTFFNAGIIYWLLT